MKYPRHKGISHLDRAHKVLRTRLRKQITKNSLVAKFYHDSKNVSLKIGSRGPQKLGPFSSLFLMRKTLSSGQKWFLRPYFPLIRGMFLLRSGLRFSFRALEVPEPRVRKRPLSLLIWSFPHSQFGHFQCPKRKYKTTFQ